MRTRATAVWLSDEDIPFGIDEMVAVILRIIRSTFRAAAEGTGDDDLARRLRDAADTLAP